MKRYFSAVFLLGLVAMLIASVFYRTNENRNTNLNRLDSFDSGKFDSTDEAAIKEIDAEGNASTTGYSYPLLFSTTPGALNGGQSVGVTKLNTQGNQIIYAARFGSSSSDNPEDIAVDSAGNAYVTGSTNCGTSPTNCDFPILNAAQPNYAGSSDIFVSKLNATGSA